MLLVSRNRQNCLNRTHWWKFSACPDSIWSENWLINLEKHTTDEQCSVLCYNVLGCKIGFAFSGPKSQLPNLPSDKASLNLHIPKFMCGATRSASDGEPSVLEWLHHSPLLGDFPSWYCTSLQIIRWDSFIFWGFLLWMNQRPIVACERFIALRGGNVPVWFDCWCAFSAHPAFRDSFRSSLCFPSIRIQPQLACPRDKGTHEAQLARANTRKLVFSHKILQNRRMGTRFSASLFHCSAMCLVNMTVLPHGYVSEPRSNPRQKMFHQKWPVLTLVLTAVLTITCAWSLVTVQILACVLSRVLIWVPPGVPLSVVGPLVLGPVFFAGLLKLVFKAPHFLPPHRLCIARSLHFWRKNVNFVFEWLRFVRNTIQVKSLILKLFRLLLASLWWRALVRVRGNVDPYGMLTAWQ